MKRRYVCYQFGILKKVSKVACNYPIEKTALFGFYEESKQAEKSDLDFQVEISTPVIPFFLSSEVKYKLQDEPNADVNK